MTADYPVTNRNRLRRRHERGHYDHATVHAILDAAMVCHIAYVIDGQPFCTPTSFWREGTGSTGTAPRPVGWCGRRRKAMPVCLTVTHSRCAGVGTLGLPPFSELSVRHGVRPGASGYRSRRQIASYGRLHRSLLSADARPRCGRPPRRRSRPSIYWRWRSRMLRQKSVPPASATRKKITPFRSGVRCYR